MKSIVIRGAREHNLKNIDLEIPRDALVVVSGLSGSGKSSLAFDTIFAEGQRRYVESLSSYARQFLGRLDKPDLDYIEGLSPAIAIEQKTTHRNPRSTVGTVTEIYDYLRLLFARVGIPHCPKCGREIQEQSVDQIVDSLLVLPQGTRLILLAPVVGAKKGEHQKILDDAKRMGYVRARIDGEMRTLDEEISLDRKRAHTIEIVVDRLAVAADSRRRLAESVEGALETSGGNIIALVKDRDGEREMLFSQKSSCPTCGISVPELQPRLFSFNNPFGACPSCSGLGVTLEFDPDLVIPDPGLSFNEGGIAPYNPKANWYRSQFESLAKHFGFSLDTAALGSSEEGLRRHPARDERKDRIPLPEPRRTRQVGVRVGLPRRAERAETALPRIELRAGQGVDGRLHVAEGMPRLRRSAAETRGPCRDRGRQEHPRNHLHVRCRGFHLFR